MGSKGRSKVRRHLMIRNFLEAIKYVPSFQAPPCSDLNDTRHGASN